jgi:hypothetical protein
MLLASRVWIFTLVVSSFASIISGMVSSLLKSAYRLCNWTFVYTTADPSQILFKPSAALHTVTIAPLIFTPEPFHLLSYLSSLALLCYTQTLRGSYYFPTLKAVKA